ncbi:MAG: hypothetical protein V1929_00185 [bacterium]
MNKPSSDPAVSPHAVALHADPQEAQMAMQLSAQYQRAIGGLWHVMVFGAMMLKLREHLNSARGIQRGQIAYQGSIKEWIETNCPEVNTSTAWRFMALAAGLKQELKLGAKADLCLLLDRDGAQLPPAQQKLRNSIALFLEGKSQRQLLFQFAVADPKPRGGDTGVKRGPITEEMKVELHSACMRLIIQAINRDILQEKFYARCPRALLESLHGALLDAKNEIGKVLKK